MLNKIFKHTYGCWYTDDNKSVNSIINYIMYYDIPDEGPKEYSNEVLIILNKGIELTGNLLEKLGLIRPNSTIRFYTEDLEYGNPETTRIHIKTYMNEKEVNSLINCDQ